MRLNVPVLALAAMACVAAPAAAQLKPRVPTGSHIKQKPETVEYRRAASIRSNFARCVVQGNRAMVDLFLRTSNVGTMSDDPALSGQRIAKTLGMERCLGREALVGDLSMQMKPANLRAMLQESLYLDRFKAPPPAGEPVAPARTVELLTRDKRAASLAQFTDCVAARDTAGADAVLRHVSGSPEEGRAARALVPDLSGCVPKEQTITFTPQSIRIFVAEGLWHRYFGAMAPTGN